MKSLEPLYQAGVELNPWVTPSTECSLIGSYILGRGRSMFAKDLACQPSSFGYTSTFLQNMICANNFRLGL